MNHGAKINVNENTTNKCEYCGNTIEMTNYSYLISDIKFNNSFSAFESNSMIFGIVMLIVVYFAMNNINIIYTIMFDCMCVYYTIIFTKIWLKIKVLVVIWQNYTKNI